MYSNSTQYRFHFVITNTKIPGVFVITLTKLLPRHNNLLNRFSNGTRSGGMSTQEEITHRYVAHRLQVQQTVQLVEISELLREVNSLCIHTDSNAIGQLSVKNLAAG